MLTGRFVEAVAVAARLHATQVRKGTTIPYVSHLLGTCAIALEYRADEDQAIAALLHDAIEDNDPVMARAEVDRFGPVVRELVEACTDTDEDPKPPWRPRKEAYIARIATEGRGALLVSASDKLHNARAIVADLQAIGPAIWARFNPESDQLWYYRNLVEAYQANPVRNPALIAELDQVVTEMEQLASSTIAPT